MYQPDNVLDHCTNTELVGNLLLR